MASKYDTSVDLNSNSSHAQIVDLVGYDKRVLEVGAATGYLAEIMGGRGCRVTGIELDPDAARQAEKYCDRVIVGDVEHLHLSAELGGESFDVIVFGDVLEHLKDPLQTLKRFKYFLGFGGYIVASIPNIAHGSVRLALMLGSFDYRPLGLLDDTHLRFFTAKSVKQLFKDAGFVVTELRRTRLGIFDTEVEVDRDRIPNDALRMVRQDPEALTYQFVLAASPSGEADVSTVSSKEKTIYELTRKLRNFEHLEQLLDSRAEQLAVKEHEVTSLTQEVSRLKDNLARMVQSGKRGT